MSYVKRWLAGVCALLLTLSLSACHTSDGPSGPSSSAPSASDGTGDSDTSAPSGSGSEVSAPDVPAAGTSLEVPKFSKANALLYNKNYTIQVREEGGEWQSIKAYLTRINANTYQNIKATDPVENASTVYFGIGDKPVEVSLKKAEGRIDRVEFLPESEAASASVSDGEATVRITAPCNLCLRINGERYDLVHIFVNAANPDRPTESSGDVIVIPPGRTSAPMAGTQSWNGALRDLRIYPTSLTEAQVQQAAGGADLGGYTYRWALESDANEAGGRQSTVLGEPGFDPSFEGAPTGCVRMNADGEAIQTGLGQSSDELDHYSITVWAYLKDSRQTYTIMNELLKVEEGGYIASNIGDWVHPYQTSIPMKVGVWQQITLVKDGSDVTIYIDGESGGREEREPQENPYTYIIGSALPGRELLLHDNQTLVISPGAVLYGTVAVRGAKNVTIMGGGMIDITQSENSATCYSGLVISHSENVLVRDIIVNNPRIFSVRTMYSDNVTWKNVKIFSSWGPSDGCNILGSSHVTVDGCFIRSNDDGVSVSGGSHDLTIRNTTIANDAAHSFFISDAQRVTAENIYILDSKQFSGGYRGVLGICADGAAEIADITFAHIRVGDIRDNALFNFSVQYDWSYTLEPGRSVRNITVSDLEYNGEGYELSTIQGYEAGRTVSGVHFENVRINGQHLTGEWEGMLEIGKFADNVTFS